MLPRDLTQSYSKPALWNRKPLKFPLNHNKLTQRFAEPAFWNGPLVRLLPVYTPLVKRQLTNKRRVKQCSEEASDALKDSHHWLRGGLWATWTGHWQFNRAHHRLHKLLWRNHHAHQDGTNNTPWVTPDLRALPLERKKRKLFQSTDRETEEGAEGS